jgi:UDP-N-acetylglucosamine:LPS N-acetylglucosamine transferase
MDSILFVSEKTLGHVTPLINIEKLMKKKFKTFFIISGSKVEKKYFQENSIEHFNYNYISSLFSFLLKMKKNHNLIYVFSSGSKFSYKVNFIAKLLNIKTGIIELNYYPGISNIMMSNNSDIYTSNKISNHLYSRKARIHQIELPIFIDQKKNKDYKIEMNIPKNKKILLILTGTIGNPVINNLIKDNVDTIINNNIYVIWQTGINDNYQNNNKNVICKNLFNDMNNLYQIADFCISSAGANTINELLYFKIPFVLIPHPKTKFNHQQKNSSYINSKFMLLKNNNKKTLDYIIVLLNNQSKYLKIKQQFTNFSMNKQNKTFNKIVKDSIEIKHKGRFLEEIISSIFLCSKFYFYHYQ